MAPADISHETRSYLHVVLHPRVHLERRDASTPPGTVVGFAAAIAILSAIILGETFIYDIAVASGTSNKYQLAKLTAGYATYRGVKWYRARHYPSAASPNSIKSSRFKHNGPTEISISHSNYDHFLAVSQAKQSHLNPRSDQDTEGFSPLPHTASTAVNGYHTPHLDWRPPMLTPWSRNGNSQGGSDSTSDLEVHRVEISPLDGIPYPSQAYSAKERRRGAGGVFGFMRNAAGGIKGGRKSGDSDKLGDDGAYLMVNSSPPVGSPPPQYVTKTANGSRRDLEELGMDAEVIGISRTAEYGGLIRGFGGATSPPLPPLPPAPFAPMDSGRRSGEKSAEMEPPPRPFNATSTKSIPAPINLAPPPHSVAWRPTSREPTTKASRHLTATSSLNGHGAIPSPRVSSLFRASSRLSHHHGYTPASPGLPNPPVIPPIPALPAHLFRFPSMSKTSSSIGSADNHGKHDSTISDSTIHGGDPATDGTEDPAKGPDGKPLPRTMVVTCTFTPSLSDELPLTIGETVSMLEEYIDEWCFVQRVRIMVKEGGGGTHGGAVLSVDGTIDVQNIVTVPAAGEGNLGAVPRFCLSEWPLAVPDSKEEDQTMRLGQETLPVFTSPALLPSPPITSTTPTFTPGNLEGPRQPSLPPTSWPAQAQIEAQNARPRPLPTPTPKVPVIPAQHLDSKFSSWGSAAESPASMPMPDISGIETVRRNQSGNNAGLAPSPTLSALQRANEPPQLVSSSIHPLLSTTSSQVPPGGGSTSSHIHPLANDSRTPSFSSAATSIAQPIVPPTSPDSQSPRNISAGEDDNIKRVSKPPLAPRLSRFPPTPDEEESSMHMDVRGHSRNGSRDAGIPRAAERTVTMPPLPRRPSATDPSIAELPTPTQQQINTIAHSTVASVNANTHWGNIFPSRDNFSTSTTPSTSSAPSTGMGTSVGSKTPSTAATSSANSSPAGKGAFSKRFTAAPPVTRSGSLNTINPPARPPMGAGSPNFGGRVPVGPEKKTGPGMFNFKALRTGSSTAGVAPVGR